MILIFSVFVNIILFYSIFDLHYSALELNEKVGCDKILNASSKRVVLIITDGLSSELLYNVTAQNWTRPSFIRKIVEGKGTWGVSKAYVPTISKPAFFALTSGTHFDSSFIWRHIHLTKVKVDLVFNHVDEVFFSGDPAVSRFLDRDATKRWHIRIWNSTFENEVHTDYYKMDDFACQGVHEFFANKSLNVNLHKDKSIFIFYLDASDNCGHNFFPFSQKCTDVVKNMDRNVEMVNDAFESFFGDNRTTFILTSDHGISRTGFHGSGEDIQLQTPILAWGSGVKRGGGLKHPTINISKAWKAENLSHVYINQVDIAPLISVFLGNPAPVHSNGLLPTGMLDLDDETIIDSLYCNEKQVWNMVLEQARWIGDYRILQKLLDSNINVTETRLKMNQSVAKKTKLETIRLANLLNRLHRKQLSLYRNYFKKVILSLVSIIYIGWGIVLFERVLISSKVATEQNSKRSFSFRTILKEIKQFVGENCSGLKLIVDFFFLIFGVGFVLFVHRANWPCHFVLYAVLTTVLWWLAVKQAYVFQNIFAFKSIYASNTMSAAFLAICAVGIIIGINVTYVRQVGFLILGVVQFSLTKNKAEATVHATWFVSTSFLLIFMDSAVINLSPDTNLMKIGGATWICIAIMHLYYYRRSTRDCLVTFAYLFILYASQWNVLSFYEIRSDEERYHDKLLRIKWSWMILFFAPLLSFFSLNGLTRLLHVCYGLASTCILLTVRHESTGLAAFCVNLLAWFCLEIKKSSKSLETADEESNKGLSRDDLRRGFMFLAYTWIGYYSLGNIDYPISYNIYWTDCFVSSFQQLNITLLILYKLLIPLIALCVVFSMMYIHLGHSFRTTVEWYLFLNNMAAFYFFHCTKGENYTYVKIGYSFFHHAFSAIVPIVAICLLHLTHILHKINLYTFFSAFYTRGKEQFLSKFQIKELE